MLYNKETQKVQQATYANYMVNDYFFKGIDILNATLEHLVII